MRAGVRATQRRTADDDVKTMSGSSVGDQAGCGGRGQRACVDASSQVEWGSDSGVQGSGVAYTNSDGDSDGDGDDNGLDGDLDSDSGSGDSTAPDRRDWRVGIRNNSRPAPSHMQLHTYTSDSAAWITAPLLVFSALNWCDSCESLSCLSYPITRELPERYVGCTSAARSLPTLLAPFLHLASLQLPCSSSSHRPPPASLLQHPPTRPPSGPHHLKPVQRQGSSFEGLVRHAATPIRLYLAGPSFGTPGLALDGGSLPVRPRAGARDQFPPHDMAADDRQNRRPGAGSPCSLVFARLSDPPPRYLPTPATRLAPCSSSRYVALQATSQYKPTTYTPL